MVNRWFISDHHLGHYNILKYGERPFKDLAEMHDALVEAHNAVVKPNDHVSFLGDLTLKRGGRLDREWLVKEIKRYNGHKRLYLGNHDHFPVKVYLECFEKVYATWRDDFGVVFSHIPLHPRSLGGRILGNVHGHIHQNKSYPPAILESGIKPYINVSCEVIGYTPVHFDEIMAMIRNQVREYEETDIVDAVDYRDYEY